MPPTSRPRAATPTTPTTRTTTTARAATPAGRSTATATTASPAALTTTSVAPSGIGQRVVWLASQQAGKPYVWGAAGPYSFDCSGLVQYVFAQLGRSLPHNTDAIYAVVQHVPQQAKQPVTWSSSARPEGSTTWASTRAAG
ncbi:MAG TPA: NlpC/P60 family protein [Frankiaceae bacterium]|nr:NlpC/P60 family protein [Frankiaceae bacterium]